MYMDEIIKAEEGEIFDIELEEDFLEKNMKIAEENKTLLKKYGIIAIDVMGSIGSGKTSLIERLIERLKTKYRIAVINGDLTTSIDCDIIKRHGVKVIQINTGKECHLDANLVKKALKKIDIQDINVLFIENVGNLICPADFPLGADKRIVVISVTEGPYMVVKHPFIFAEANVVVINKIDLAKAMDVDVNKLESDVKSVNPNAKVIKTNCKAGEGIIEVIKALNL
ncbi:MAG: hydrogenase nickel incorporation protein HypB [Candidatus Bathyarchaeia archaeon]